MKGKYIIVCIIITLLICVACYIEIEHPFLSRLGLNYGWLISSILSFVALLGLLYNIEQTKNQFNRQVHDEQFYKLMDNLNTLISSNYIIVNGVKLSNSLMFQTLCMDVVKHLKLSCVKNGHDYFIDNFSTLDDRYYHLLYDDSNKQERIPYDELKHSIVSKLSSLTSKSEREQYMLELPDRIKYSFAELYEKLGIDMFYDRPLNEKREAYSLAISFIFDKHIDILDKYIQQLIFILKYISESTKDEQRNYITYVDSQLSAYELLLIFYFVAGKNIIDAPQQWVKRFVNFNRLVLVKDSMLNAPSLEVAQKEWFGILSSIEDTHKSYYLSD